MAKKREDPPPAGSPAWMATFGDLMNLLLCFFVLLFSMSSVDAAKYDMLVNSLSSAFSILPSGGSTMTDGALIASGISQMPDIGNYFGNTLSKGEAGGQSESEGTGGEQAGETSDDGDASGAETGEQTGETATDGTTTGEATGESENPGETAGEKTETGDMMEEEAAEVMEEKELSQSEKMAQTVEEMTHQLGIQDLVEVDFNGQYVRITLSGALLFDSGSAELAPDALPLVEKIGKIINLYDSNIVEVEGHTDNVPIHSSKYESNDVLSMYRALYVASYLRDKSKVPDENIVSAGRGAYVPLADNNTPEGRARNRRVEIKIYNELNSDAAKGAEEE